MICVLGGGDYLSSILADIKKLLGLEKDYIAFDTDVIIHINSAFMTLNELGVGPEEGFMISGYEEEWNAFISEDIQSLFQGIKTYIYLRVKLLFDPPTNSFLVDALDKQIKELEWRLNVTAENSEKFFRGSYDGPYVITPNFEDQILDTEKKKMEENLNVKKIQVTEVGNTAKGTTLSI